MSTEQVKCSCGSVSSKTAPSIKLNKQGSTACANSACSWRQTSLRLTFIFENLPFHFSHSCSSPHMQTHSFITVPVILGRHANAAARAQVYRAGLSSTNPATSAQPNCIPDLHPVFNRSFHLSHSTFFTLYYGQIWLA